jgi:hypothetical protein
MNGHQMLLVLAAIVLFSLLAINVNRTIYSSETQTNKSEYLATATAVGQSVMNKISNKAFDQGTINNPAFNFAIITAPDSLNCETGESYSTYNDVDDYNNYTESDTTPRSDVYNVRVQVNYVNDNNFLDIINSKSHTKRIEVLVTSNYMAPDTLHLYYYKSY